MMLLHILQIFVILIGFFTRLKAQYPYGEVLIYEFDHLRIDSQAVDFTNYQIIYCNIAQSIQRIMVFNWIGMTKSFSVPPSYAINVEFDIGVNQFIQFTDLNVEIDGKRYIFTSSQFIEIDRYAGEACTMSYLQTKMAQVQITQELVNTDFNISIVLKNSGVIVDFTMYFLRVYYSPCHPSCMSCKLDLENLCETCNINSFLKNKVCTTLNTNIGQKYEKGQNQAACSLSNSYFTYGNNCHYHPNCSQGSLISCYSCNNQYFLLNSKCYPITSQDFPVKLNGKYLLFEDRISNVNCNYQQSIFTPKINRVPCSICGQFSFLLGYLIGIPSQQINIIPNAFSQYVSFKYLLIDAGSLSPGSEVSIQVTFDNIIETILFDSDTLVSYCGTQAYDIIGFYSKYFHVRVNNSEFQGGDIVIKNTSTKTGVYLGIRQLSINRVPCNKNCSKCTFENRCISCLPGFTEIQTNSGLVCQCDIGHFIHGYECSACGSFESCEIINQNGNSKCISSAQQIFGYLCVDCQKGYFFDETGTHQCEMCSINCFQCQQSQNKCVSCSAGLYLVKDKCVDCTEPLYILLNGYCYRCATYCNSCSGTEYNECLDCIDGYYLKNQGYCSSCTSNCKKCVGSKNTDCQICYDGYYLNNTNNCTPCASDCNKCDANSCTECKQTGMDYMYLLDGICFNCLGPYFFIGQTCKRCHSSCSQCFGDAYNQCSTCKQGFFLDSQKSCQPCSSNCYHCDITGCLFCNTNARLIQGSCFPCDQGTYLVDIDLCLDCKDTVNFILIEPFCIRCNYSCNSCFGPSFSECKNCFDGAYLDDKNICVNCNQECLTCTVDGCTSCHENSILLNGNCIPCEQGTFLLDGQCQSCSDTTKFVIVGQICKRCNSSCNSCFESGANSCKNCFEGYYLDFDNSCKLCIKNDCKWCTSTTCNECFGSKKLMNGNCENCLTEQGKYSVNENCFNCNNSCMTCTGGSSADCLECASGYTFSSQTHTCETCLIGEYDSSRKFCLTCSNRCKDCKEVNANTSFTSNQFCNYCYCEQCRGDKILISGLCYDNCGSINSGLIINPVTAKCECQPELKMLSVNSEIVCLTELPFGYFCPGNGQLCVECKSSCEQCESVNSCKLCLKGHYLWRGECIPSCFPSLSIVPNDSSRICECEKGKQLKKRDDDEIQNSSDSALRAQDQKCLQPLQLSTVELINSLSKPKSRQNIPDVIQNNYIILTYNRRPTQEEFSTFSFLLMKDTLTLDKEYRILNILFEAYPSSSILIEISVTSNRKISDFNVKIDALNDRVSLNNVIFISPELSSQVETNSSKNISSAMGDVGQQFMNSGSSVINKLVSFSKEFQIVCSLSNVVQLLAPVYFFHHTLPPLINYGTLLGASFIFNQIPSEQTVEFSQESSQNRVLTSESAEQSQSISKKLSDFGLTGNIFSNLIGVHIMVFTSVGLMILCYVCRKVFTGKQYTIVLVDKISNAVTSQLQSSITMIMCMVAYCFSTGEGTVIASIYMAFYFVIQLQIVYLACSKSPDYLYQNIPNFFVDINHKLKGAKWYLTMQFTKKHIVILLILTLSQSPRKCCIIISSIFFAQAVIFAYFRYFKYKLILIAKILQELLISVLFILLAIVIQQYEEMAEKSVISNEELVSSLDLANIVLISMVVCIILSFIFSVYRMILTILSLIEAWKKYKQASQRVKFSELDAMNNSVTIQMHQRFNSGCFQAETDNPEIETMDTFQIFNKKKM